MNKWLLHYGEILGLKSKQLTKNANINFETLNKMKTKIVITTILLSFLIHSCISFGGYIDPENNDPGIDEDDETEIIEGEEAKFLLLHQNDMGVIGEGSFMSVLTIKNEEAEYQKINLYPLLTLRDIVDINNERVVIGLHYDFNTNGESYTYTGAWFDIGSSTWEELPILPADEGRYAFYQGTSNKVSKSGHIFYFASTNNSTYHDDNRYTLVRYDPKTKELKQALSPKQFALLQPEKGPDTETADLEYAIFPSDDGRYVFGYMLAYGIDGGSYHYDYKILYRYNFDTDNYTRIGNPDEKSVTVIGMTTDQNNLAYYSSVENNYTCNLVNTSTNKVIQTKLFGGQAYNNMSRWNDTGYCSGETDKSIGIYNLLENSYSEIRTQARPYDAQYGKDGSQIYFMINGDDGKFLCKTSDNTPEATIDTVCALQSNVHEFMVVR